MERPNETIKNPPISYAFGKRSNDIIDSIIPAAKLNKHETTLSEGL
jgi:hypothetical protein